MPDPVSMTQMVSPAATTATAGTTVPKNQMDKETFLKLLVAQLKYQDPSKPTDSAQFMAQTAQFSALEKMEEVAELTAKSISTTTAFGAAGLVGKTVSYPGPDGTSKTGVVSGVTFTSDGPLLNVGGADIAMSSITGVRSGSGTPATPAT